MRAGLCKYNEGLQSSGPSSDKRGSSTDGLSGSAGSLAGKVCIRKFGRQSLIAATAAMVTEEVTLPAVAEALEATVLAAAETFDAALLAAALAAAETFEAMLLALAPAAEMERRAAEGPPTR